jgi:excisionase family DNA binding protein
MSGPVDIALRELIREELRLILAGELAELRAFVRATCERPAMEPGGIDEPLITIKAASELAGVAPNTIRKWVARGMLARYGVGRVQRVLRSELLAAMRGRGVAPADGIVDLEARAREIRTRRK